MPRPLMRAARLLAATGLAGLLASAAAHAQLPPPSAAPAQAAPAPAASAGLSLQPFETAYATSFYGFDACGDQVAGKTFRSALLEKLDACPFSPEARQHFRQWSAAQRKQSSQAMGRLVAENGGLPVKLEGMTQTCHEQRNSPDYLAVRDKLDQYAQGLLRAEALLPQGCDAPVIAP